jgi:site-specific recombinase XerD
MRKTPSTLAALLHGFFLEWLGSQRNVSEKTVIAYRDTWKLFLRFVAKRHETLVARLHLEDLTEDMVLAFLQHLEQDRRSCIATRNCRLAALRSFYSYVADRDPMAAQQCAAVRRVPFKRGPKLAMAYLDGSEVAAIISQAKASLRNGQRDHVLLSLLYNTGARIQEVLDLRVKDCHLALPAYVRLLGKGRKERISPLWPETSKLLAGFVQHNQRSAEDYLFLNRYRTKLTASGFRFRLRKYVSEAAAKQPSLLQKKITPHTFRHTIAVHLVASGVDLTVIKSWLGHAHLDTTSIYAEANIETKRKALEQSVPKSQRSKLPRWKRDDDLLA